MNDPYMNISEEEIRPHYDLEKLNSINSWKAHLSILLSTELTVKHKVIWESKRTVKLERRSPVDIDLRRPYWYTKRKPSGSKGLINPDLNEVSNKSAMTEMLSFQFYEFLD